MGTFSNNKTEPNTSVLIFSQFSGTFPSYIANNTSTYATGNATGIGNAKAFMFNYQNVLEYSANSKGGGGNLVANTFDINYSYPAGSTNNGFIIVEQPMEERVATIISGTPPPLPAPGLWLPTYYVIPVLTPNASGGGVASVSVQTTKTPIRIVLAGGTFTNFTLSVSSNFATIQPEVI